MFGLRFHRLISFSLSISLLLLLTACGTTQPPAPDFVPPSAEPALPELLATFEQAPIAAPEVVQAPPTEAVQVLAAAPKQYTVRNGDTLWSIASQYLRDPWFWPEIWHVNPQIRNPHLLYPGDVITLYYTTSGQPRVAVAGGPRVHEQQVQQIPGTSISREDSSNYIPGFGDGTNAQGYQLPTTKLKPQVRISSLDKRLEAVPVSTVKQLIIRPRVLGYNELADAPYIVGAPDNRIIYANNDKVYVKGLKDPLPGDRYSVFRPGARLTDPQTDAVLGYEAVHVGEGVITKSTTPATFYFTETVREGLRGDKLLPAQDTESSPIFQPRAPTNLVKGRIIDFFDAIAQIGQSQVAVINLGKQQGLEKGHVLEVQQSGFKTRDQFEEDPELQIVTLPNERSGLLMIFRVFDKVSYGLVMSASRTLRIGDQVSNP